MASLENSPGTLAQPQPHPAKINPSQSRTADFERAAPNPENVTRIVGRQIKAITPTFFPHDVEDTCAVSVTPIQAVVREELLNEGVQPTCAEDQPCVSYRPPVSPFLRNSILSCFQYCPAHEWRDPDDWPIYFNCRGVGNVTRYCQSRSCPHRQNNCYRHPEEPLRRFYSRLQPQPNNSADSAGNRWSGCSPSPQRQQSRSPRRFSSPTPQTSYFRSFQKN